MGVVARDDSKCRFLNAEVPSGDGRAPHAGCDDAGWLSTDGRKPSCL